MSEINEQKVQALQAEVKTNSLDETLDVIDNIVKEVQASPSVKTYATTHYKRLLLHEAPIAAVVILAICGVQLDDISPLIKAVASIGAVVVGAFPVLTHNKLVSQLKKLF
jgi:hypothetical protein